MPPRYIQMCAFQVSYGFLNSIKVTIKINHQRTQGQDTPYSLIKLGKRDGVGPVTKAVHGTSVLVWAKVKGMRWKGKILKQLGNEMDMCGPLSWCCSLFCHLLSLGEAPSIEEDRRRKAGIYVMSQLRRTVWMRSWEEKGQGQHQTGRGQGHGAIVRNPSVHVPQGGCEGRKGWQ